MARQFMGGDFRAISKAAPVAAEPQQDLLLALVEQFATALVYRDPAADPNAPLPEGALDFSGDEPMRVTADGSLEPAVRPQTSGVIDLSGAAPDFAALFVEDAQEPVVEPEPSTGDASPDEAATPEDGAPADAEPDEKVEAQEQVQDEQDYDPIAAVLG